MLPALLPQLPAGQAAQRPGPVHVRDGGDGRPHILYHRALPCRGGGHRGGHGGGSAVNRGTGGGGEGGHQGQEGVGVCVGKIIWTMYYCYCLSRLIFF